MKLKEFSKSFVGAAIGVIIYQLLFDISDPFQSYWLNYFAEIALISICVSGGLMTVHLLVNNFSLFKSKENA